MTEQDIIDAAEYADIRWDGADVPLGWLRHFVDALCKQEERNFCPRCGKRSGKNDWDVHTCSLPEPEQEPKRKYRRGDRLLCLETEEWCVIHISGTDRQWVKFTDSHIGVYTNEQVADMFELIPKEPEHCKYGYEPKSCTSDPMNCQCAHDAVLEMAEQEPVAWGVIASNTGKMCQVELDFAEVEEISPKWVVPLYTTPPQPEKPWVGLTDGEMYLAIRPLYKTDAHAQGALIISKDEYCAIEAALKEKNT